MEGDVIITQDLVLYDIKGEDANGRLLGQHVSTGIGRPHFWDRARYYGEEQRLAAALEAYGKAIRMMPRPESGDGRTGCLDPVDQRPRRASAPARSPMPFLFSRIATEKTPAKRKQLVKRAEASGQWSRPRATGSPNRQAPQIGPGIPQGARAAAEGEGPGAQEAAAEGPDPAGRHADIGRALLHLLCRLRLIVAAAIVVVGAPLVVLPAARLGRRGRAAALVRRLPAQAPGEDASSTNFPTRSTSSCAPSSSGLPLQ